MTPTMPAATSADFSQGVEVGEVGLAAIAGLGAKGGETSAGTGSTGGASSSWAELSAAASGVFSHCVSSAV
ncbi:MAG: hypothetical protein WBF45_04705 [Acidobacteriaceae bacterium]